MSQTQSLSNAPHTAKLLPLLALCSFIVGLDSMITVPLLPAMASTSHISMDLGALLVTAYALAYMVTAPVFGVVSDRKGRKLLIQWGIIVLGAGTVLTGFGNNLVLLLIYRALTGIGAGMLQPAVFALISDRFPYERRGRALGIVMSSLTGANLIGVPLGTYLAQLVGWQWTFWVVGIMALVSLGLISAGLPKDTRQPSDIRTGAGTTVFHTFRTALANRKVGLALFATLLWFAGMQGMFTNIGMFYSQNFGLTASQTGIVLMLAGSGNMLGSIMGGKLADRIGKQAVIGTASILCAIAVMCFSLADSNVFVAAAVQVIWSAVFGLGHAALTAFVSELNPAIRGTVLSLNSSAMYAGMTVATAASAALLQTGSFWPVGLMCAIAAVTVFPLIALLVRERTTNHGEVSLNKV